MECCTTFGSGDIEENASAVFFYSDFTIILVEYTKIKGLRGKFN